MEIGEMPLTETLMQQLLEMSVLWEQEQSCYGYRRNTPEDLQGRRVFVAGHEGHILGYLFGQCTHSKNARSIMPDGTPYFELEELFVLRSHRAKGIGKALFRAAEETLRQEKIGCIMLSTASKNFRAILHFYIEELDMQLWSARLYKNIL